MVTRFLNISTDQTLSDNSDIQAVSQKAIKAYIAGKVVQLNYLQTTTPTGYSIGQKWLNPDTKLLYTAVSSSSWGTGVTLQNDQFFTFDDLLYYYSGSELRSYSSLTLTEQNEGRQVKIWLGTRAQYNALTEYDLTNTLYYVIEDSLDFATLATQTQFDNGDATVAATPYQIQQTLGNYLSLKGGNLNAGAILRLTNASGGVSALSYGTDGNLSVSTGLYVTNTTSTNSAIIRSGNLYKVNTSGATALWSDSKGAANGVASLDSNIKIPSAQLPLATTSAVGAVKPDGSTILVSSGTISVATATTSNFGAVKPDGTTITIYDGVISASGSGQLSNTATGTNALTILGSPSTTAQTHNIGIDSYANIYSTVLGYNANGTTASTAIGTNATAGNYSVAIGSSNGTGSKTEASGSSAIAIGYNAKSTANSAVQIGAGTNSTANTLQFLGNTIIDSDGKVPNARIPAATSTQLGGIIVEYDPSTNVLNIRTS